MLEYIEDLDKTLFLFFNGFHSPASDAFWLVITNIPTWIPLYAALLVWIIAWFKKDSVWIIIGALLVITIADQTTSAFMKPFFGRLRPCHDPELSRMVHLAGGCGGRFSFASGHAANSFGLAMYVWLVFRHRFPWTSLLFLWASFIAFSRIMIGVHYPFDIVAGGIIGIFTGWVVYRLTDSVYFHFKMEPLIKD